MPSRTGTAMAARRLRTVLSAPSFRHRLFATLAVVCFAMPLAAAVFAVRGFWYQETLSYQCYSGHGFDHSLSITSSRGIIILRRNTGSAAERGPVMSRTIERTGRPFNAGSWQAHRIAVERLGARQWAGFLYWTDAAPGGTDRVSTALWIPQWFLLLSLALACGGLAWAAAGARRRFRSRQGLCPRCGYDLRATPGRCPECGHEASKPTPAGVE